MFEGVRTLQKRVLFSYFHEVLIVLTCFFLLLPVQFIRGGTADGIVIFVIAVTCGGETFAQGGYQQPSRHTLPGFLRRSGMP